MLYWLKNKVSVPKCPCQNFTNSFGRKDCTCLSAATADFTICRPWMNGIGSQSKLRRGPRAPRPRSYPLPRLFLFMLKCYLYAKSPTASLQHLLLFLRRDQGGLSKRPKIRLKPPRNLPLPPDQPGGDFCPRE